MCLGEDLALPAKAAFDGKLVHCPCHCEAEGQGIYPQSFWSVLNLLRLHFGNAFHLLCRRIWLLTVPVIFSILMTVPKGPTIVEPAAFLAVL